MAEKRILLITVASIAAVTIVGAVVVSRRRSQQEPGLGRWRVVTVYRPQDEIAPAGQFPQPLAELGELVEIRMTDAPGGKGTELAARPRPGESAGALAALGRATGNDPRQAVRRALRESKQLLEAGEVIRVNPKPEGHRPASPAGKLTDLVARRSMGEGVL
jgi:hypothetical protein